MTPPGPELLNEAILEALVEALKAVRDPRFYKSERGYQASLYSALQGALLARRLLEPPFILEAEHQKSPSRHNTNQRPDIILHAPAEQTGRPVSENNRAAFALKLNASPAAARSDFGKLDEMCSAPLNYPLAVFINIASTEHRLVEYQGQFRDRLHAFATGLNDGHVDVVHASFRNGVIQEERPA